MSDINQLLKKYNIKTGELEGILQKYFDICDKKKNNSKKYFQTNKGKEANRLAQRRYYYKTKCNNKYHRLYNPEGIKTAKQSRAL